MPARFITVFIRSVYGKPLTYVHNTEQAKHLFALTGTRTLEPRHIEALEALGFTIQTTQDPGCAMRR